MNRLLILLLGLSALFLTACVQANPPAERVYRTTEGGPPLSFDLEIWNANKTTLLKTITNAQAGGILGGFKWQLAPNGNTVRLEFSGRNDRMGIPVRGIAVLKVNGQEAFYGLVPDPPQRDGESRAVIVEGGATLLDKVLMDGKVYGQSGVYEIVRDILARLTPRTLTYAATQIGNGTGIDAGPVLSEFYKPGSTLRETLDTLAATANTDWAVDAGGRIHFAQPAPAALNVAYASQPWRGLPAQGREVVTRAQVRIVTGHTQANQLGHVHVTAPFTYTPAPVTATAQHADHPLYLAEISAPAPEGISLVKTVAGVDLEVQGEITDPGYALDGNPATSATFEASALKKQLAIKAPPGVRIVGAYIRYYLSAVTNEPSDYSLHLSYGGTGSVSGMTGAWALPATEGVQEAWFFLPPDVRLTPDRASMAVWRSGDVAGTFQVSEVAYLAVDEDTASNVAASLLQTPFATPAELTLKTLTPPTRNVTVTGTPDGDVAGPAALWEYQHDTEGLTLTRVRIGATGADPAIRAFKWAVRDR